MKLEYSESILYFEVGGRFFPADGWVDLVTVDLEHWIPALTSFALGHADTCRLDFMDGPFSIRLLRRDGFVAARFLENGRDKMAECVIDMKVLVRSACECIRAYHFHLHEQGNNPVHTRELAMLRKLLRK